MTIVSLEKIDRCNGLETYGHYQMFLSNVVCGDLLQNLEMKKTPVYGMTMKLFYLLNLLYFNTICNTLGKNGKEALMNIEMCHSNNKTFQILGKEPGTARAWKSKHAEKSFNFIVFWTLKRRVKIESSLFSG